MATTMIRLHEDIIRMATARAAAAGHPSVEEYIGALVLADAKAAISQELEAHLLAALDTPSREMTPANWDEKRRILSTGMESDWR